MGRIRDFAHTFELKLHELSAEALVGEIIELRAKRMEDIRAKAKSSAAKKPKLAAMEVKDGKLVFNTDSEGKRKKRGSAKSTAPKITDEEILAEFAHLPPEALEKLKAVMAKSKRGRKKKADATVEASSS